MKKYVGLFLWSTGLLTLQIHSMRHDITSPVGLERPVAPAPFLRIPPTGLIRIGPILRPADRPDMSAAEYWAYALGIVLKKETNYWYFMDEADRYQRKSQACWGCLCPCLVERWQVAAAELQDDARRELQRAISYVEHQCLKDGQLVVPTPAVLAEMKAAAESQAARRSRLLDETGCRSLCAGGKIVCGRPASETEVDSCGRSGGHKERKSDLR